MSPKQPQKPLSDSAMRLGDELQAHFRRLADAIEPRLDILERRFAARLRSQKTDERRIKALLQVTPAAAARCLLHREHPIRFFEQTERAGRTLAKLNVPPSQVVLALDEFDSLMTPLFARLTERERIDLQSARQQLLFCIILTLNEAYYNVRELETQTFHEIFRIELESRNVDVLYRRFLEVMTTTFQAQAGHLFLLSADASSWVLKASTATGVSENALVTPPNNKRRLRSLSQPNLLNSRRNHADFLDSGWKDRFRCGWSFPMRSGDRVTGVLQLGFDHEAMWLPRDEELISATSERFVIAADRARLVEDLAVREEQIRNLAEHMLHVEEMERRRISRELHDEAGQSLVCIRLQMELIEMSLPEGSDELATKLAEIRDITEKTILDTRRLIADLSPVVLEQFGLEAALRQLVKRLQSHRHCHVKLTTEGLGSLPQKLEIIVYRIIQECCNNIGKHSEASNVNISVTSADGVLSLEVGDNGTGFIVEEALKKSDSFGLAGIRERVALLGGKFTILSRPTQEKNKTSAKKHGTEVRIELPLSPRSGW